MKHWTVLAILVPVLMGCPSTPEEPSVPTGIAVTSLDRGRLSGARAYFAVHAPVRTALDVIIDFDRHAEFRPEVIESRSVAASKEGGQAFLRFRSEFADDINATCNYVIAELDVGFKIEYEMKDSSHSMWARNGTLTLLPAREGEWTVIDQEVLISALSSNRDAVLAALRADAEAFQKRIEEVAGAR
jgi:hypothetical protein